MIINASDRPFSQTVLSVPNMSSALDNWFQQLKMSIVTKTIVNFILVESLVEQTIMAVRQPLSARQLLIKPEGQRGWNWETLHVQGFNHNFDLDSVVIFNNIRYRVMQKNEWQEYGYVEYHIVQDFENPIIEKSIEETMEIQENTNKMLGLSINETINTSESNTEEVV